MRSCQRGFTIVELVVVIILLGILAATALPRFIDVDDDAHEAVVQGVLAGLQTGVSLYHAQWIAEGEPDPGTAIESYGQLRSNAAGYPYGLTDTATDELSTSAECVEIYLGVLQGGAPEVGAAVDLAAVVGSGFDVTAVRSGTECAYYYTAPTSASGDDVVTLVYESLTGIMSQTTTTLP